MFPIGYKLRDWIEPPILIIRVNDNGRDEIYNVLLQSNIINEGVYNKI